jgi:hypothetical protein
MAGSPSYGFQESASAQSDLGLSDPFVNEAGFTIYGNVSDSATTDASVTPTASLTTTQGMTQGGGSAGADGSSIGPSGGNLHPNGDSGTNLIVWTTIAGMVIALGLAIYATYRFSK